VVVADGHVWSSRDGDVVVGVVFRQCSPYSLLYVWKSTVAGVLRDLEQVVDSYHHTKRSEECTSCNRF